MARNYYANEDRHLVAVDVIIFGFRAGKLEILLIKRSLEPSKGQWSLMGGFLKKDENLDNAAKRVLHELTGLRNVYLEQLHTYGEVNRDPAARVLSTTYFALINIADYDAHISPKYSAQWWDINRHPSLIFDHNEMTERALRQLKRQTKSQPIGFELLPRKFTLPQLQQLYEAIHQRQLDKRNFRKKILSQGFLEKLDEKDKSSSKKGAYLYKFNEQKYRELTHKGYQFTL